LQTDFYGDLKKFKCEEKKQKKKGICLVNSRSVSVGPLLQQRPGPKTIEKRDTFIFVNSQIAGLFTRSKMATMFVPLDGICNLMPCLPTNTLPWQRWWGGNNIPRAQQRSGTLALLYDSLFSQRPPLTWHPRPLNLHPSCCPNRSLNEPRNESKLTGVIEYENYNQRKIVDTS